MKDSDRAALLRAARTAVTQALLSRTSSGVSPAPCVSPPSGAGVFVTVRSGGGLRGCTGSIEPETALVDAVAGCAVSAATEDPRFEPVSLDELPDVTFEISVLSPPRRMIDPGEIRIGIHGIIVGCDGRRGVLLPQIAVEHGFDVEEFLEAGCRKARLGPGAWRGKAVTVDLFTAEVFGENGPPIPLRPGPRG